MIRPNPRAFTILEIMAAVAILSFALFGMMAAINVSALTRSSAREREVVRLLRHYRSERGSVGAILPRSALSLRMLSL